MSLTEQLRAATARLAEAGVPSARHDAEVLAGHVLGRPRPQVAVMALRGDDVVLPVVFDDLVDERARRVPLQHLTGTAPFRDVQLRVGPGVFVPRPETELVAGAAIAFARELPAPVVVDLCTGSGAIAVAVAREVPGARVHAVELSEHALAWAARNVEDLAPAVDLRLGDAAQAFGDLDGAVDVVVSNPPYIPPDSEPVDPEVRDHDPAVALYGLGPDGLQVPRAVVAAAARLLRPGGLVVMEHADVQQAALLRSLTASGLWLDEAGHTDLTGTPRYVSARRA
ncbi:peptide chain release factor N(5)-glutamine methyltransferase [Angustibacter sp. McL0619]|uniref:peptide chain release factor N(5)-glutamine methyltransferase n=1 Tax=Angustibacter sp. McL0619 TaxID=3415676 RepID=UPI003CF6720A